MVISLTLLAVSACSGGSEPDANVLDEDGRATLTITTAEGKKARVKVEIADTSEERSKGLSGRDSLGEDAGMLFITERRGSGFFMKDTLIPLSVAFIGPCGEIVALADMEPMTLNVHSTPLDWRYGLEVNGGWFAENGIAVGAKVTIPQVYLQPNCPTPST